MGNDSVKINELIDKISGVKYGDDLSINVKRNSEGALIVNYKNRRKKVVVDKVCITNHRERYSTVPINFPALDYYSVVKNYYGLDFGNDLLTGFLLRDNYMVLNITDVGNGCSIMAVIDKNFKVNPNKSLSNEVHYKKVKFIISNKCLDFAFDHVPTQYRHGLRRKRF